MATLGPSLPADLHLEAREPFEWVPVDSDAEGHPAPLRLRPSVLIVALEDGHLVPAEFLGHAPSGHWEALLASYARARGWGSSLLAGHLAAALHVPSFFRVNTARALVDYGRMPGVSSAIALPSQRRAIHAPFDRWLTPLMQQDVLERHYDVIGRAFDARLATARVVLSVETRDEHDAHGRRRPPLTISSRCHVPSMPPGAAGATILDPLFPAELLESTADRGLRARICEILEAQGHDVVENYPHLLSEGSVAARAIGKHFFWRVRDAYEHLHDDATPETKAARELVWRMLLDAEHRSGDGELLRGYLHRLQRPPEDRSSVFALARAEYARIAQFVTEHRDALIDDLKRGSDRISILVVQVRKDLVWNTVNGAFGAPRVDSARAIARGLAEAIHLHLSQDIAEVTPAEVTTSAWNEPRRIVGE